MDNMDNIVVSSRVRLARNIEGLPFPRRLGRDERTYSVLLAGIKNAIGNTFDYDYYEMSRLSGIDRQSMLERHLVSYDLVKNTDNGAVIMSKDRTVSIMVNEEDHVRAQCVLGGLQLDEAYRRINAFDDALSRHVKIAFDDNLGYLTSCPTNLGTGMRASVMMFLPALTELGSMDNWIAMAQKIGLTVRGAYGEGSEAEGYLYQISNEISLGISERDILRRVNMFVEKVAENEMNATKILFEQQGVRLLDKISRAYGILTNAYMISSEESMSLISYVKLGIRQGLVKGITMATMNELENTIGGGEICREEGKSLDVVDRDIARAKKIKKTIKSK